MDHAKPQGKTTPNINPDTTASWNAGSYWGESYDRLYIGLMQALPDGTLDRFQCLEYFEL